MINITFLGTGCMQPTKLRNHAGVLLNFKEENILFDCGEGIQRQMRICGVKPAKITKLCISHWHGDHVFGIPGLMSSMGADEYAKKLQIYGPKGTKAYLKNMFKSFAAKDIIEHEVFEVEKGTFFENDEFILEAQPLNHSVPCVGFRFMEKDRRRINVSKAKKRGLEGPILGELQSGKTVEFSGKKITPDEVSYIVKGKKISYITDTMNCDGINLLSNENDLLILEGTLLDNLKKNARKSKHLTIKQAALIASENNVKKLILTHISQRYKTTDELISEARDYFDDTIIAEDFLKISI